MSTCSRVADAPVARSLARAAAHGIAVVRWPRAGSAADPYVHQPVLYLVDEVAEPPPLLGELEDWVRHPLDADEVLARTERLVARGRALGPLHVVFDAGGTLRVDGHLVILSPIETQLMAVLVPRLGAVVARPALVAAVWPDRAGEVRLLNKHLGNLRRRLDGRGLAIAAVRSHGVVLTKVAPDRTAS